jgi:high affinity Mn2+ porin
VAAAESDGQGATEPVKKTEDRHVPEDWNLHGQSTIVTQYHPSFTSAFTGPQSLNPKGRAKETFDVTLFAGVRLWQGGEAYVNPEIDQGFGLSNTFGAAGYVSGEAFKIGDNNPYERLPRAFLRQTFDLGGSEVNLEPGANQLGGTRSSDNVILTVGKFAVPDIFDTNTYAHDPRSDFLNWAVFESGAFDYAADAWGYTYGAAAEWTQSWWTARVGIFDLSKLPNNRDLDLKFTQYATMGEFEERHELFGHAGKLKLLVFNNRGNMAKYGDAVRLVQATGAPPNLALIRHLRSRPGVALNFEQEITADLGAFVRASLNDGADETFDFTDINRSVSGGLSLKGTSWSRPDDTVGLAGAINGISHAARSFFAAGGLGVLIGDGQLRRYGFEEILETYYSLHAIEHLTLSADYQLIVNPAYNTERGPVSVFGLRIHYEM